MTEPELNNPDIRQALLKSRCARGETLVAAALASEFGVSLDTIRRDLHALETGGAVQRVRGGAVPLATPGPALTQRLSDPALDLDALAKRAAAMVRDGMVLLLDGGTTITRLARHLPPMPRGLAVTPAPSVALVTLERGIPTLMIGGRLSTDGGVAVGTSAENAIAKIAADICFLGVCGLDPDFGLSADDPDEAALKARMHASATCTALVTGHAKLTRRARHHVLPCAAIDHLITDATPQDTAALTEAGIEVAHA